MNRIYISSQCHNKTQENRNEPVRRVSDIQTLCSISRHWGQQLRCGFFYDIESVRVWSVLLQYPAICLAI